MLAITRKTDTHWRVGTIPEGCFFRSTGWLPSNPWSAMDPIQSYFVCYASKKTSHTSLMQSCPSTITTIFHKISTKTFTFPYNTQKKKSFFKRTQISDGLIHTKKAKTKITNSVVKTAYLREIKSKIQRNFFPQSD